MLAIASSTAWGVDRQIGVDASLKVGYSQLAGGAPSPWGVAQSVAVGFWQRSSGAAQGVGSNNIATMEYQLPEVQPTRIRSAIFQFSGRAIQCSGDEQVVVDVYRVPGRRKERCHRFDCRNAHRDAGGGLQRQPGVQQADRRHPPRASAVGAVRRAPRGFQRAQR